MKNFSVKFENDERVISVDFTPREENGTVALDYVTSINPPLEEGVPFSEDDKTLVYLADLFLSTMSNNTPAEQPDPAEETEQPETPME